MLKLFLLFGSAFDYNHIYITVENNDSSHQKLFNVCLDFEFLGLIRQIKDSINSDTDPKSGVFFDFLNFFLFFLVCRQFSRSVGLFVCSKRLKIFINKKYFKILTNVSLLPFDHLFPDMSLNLSRVLHCLLSQNSHHI